MRILVADDDQSLSRVIQIQLQNHGHDVELTFDGQACLDTINSSFDICILDLNMPKFNGLEVLERLQSNLPCPIIVLTAYEDVNSAVKAIKLGAFDYLTKPFDAVKLMRTIELAKAQWDLSHENERLKVLLFKKEHSGFVQLDDPKLQSLVRLAATSDENILIRGETGTGKDYLAQYIHSISQRSIHPFIALNCAAIPEGLLESELFGHVKGAFTGAIEDKKGILESVEEGTLLLDEIGDMPLEIQAKLLRVLENQSYRKVGETKESKFKGRILSASHKDLHDLVKMDIFREDLYFRLNVIPIFIPPLRERPSEFLKYIEKFLPEKRLQESAKNYLKERYWAGNIRELKNYCSRVRVFIQSSTVSKKQLLELELALTNETTKSNYFELPEHGVDMDQLTNDLLLQALDRCNDNQTKAGELLGLSRQQVIHRMRKWKVEE